MATAEDGGAPSGNIPYPYAGGGAGGKFRKKPFRKQSTPYDRPPTTSRATNNSSTNTSSWMTKLFIDPASKLISYGANRLFASVFRKRLPQPPPPQPPGMDNGANDVAQVAVLNTQERVEEPAGGESSGPTNSRSNGVHELEQLLKQKTFSRLEITHLTKLLQSRAVEVSAGPAGNDGKRTEVTVLDPDRPEQFASSFLDENRNERIRTSADKSPDVLNSNVLEDDVATPAELAKSYMGSRPSKGSKTVLGIQHQGGVEDVGFLGNRPFTPRMPVTSLKNPVNHAAPENGFITPRTRGRAAIYNMARAANSRGSRSNNTGNAGPSIPSSPFLLTENGEKFESLPMSLKRRNSVLDDDVGFTASVRRTRQKPNLLAPKPVGTVPMGSRAKQNLQLIGEPGHKVFQGVGETQSESTPSASRSRVPSKSSEMAARIFQHLEKLTPKEKSPESKLVAAHDKSSVKFVSGHNSIATSSHTHDRSSQKPQNNKESGNREAVAPSDMGNPLVKHGSTESVSASVTAIKTVNFPVENGAPHPQKKRAFRMTAPEDFLEHDDEVHSNGVGPTVSSGKMGTVQVPFTGSKSAPVEVPKSVNTTLASEATEVSQSAAIPFSVAASEKSLVPTTSPVFSFSSKVTGKFPTLPSESTEKTESTLENPNSLFNVSASTGSQSKISEFNKSGLSSPLKADNINGASDTATHAKEQQISSSYPGSAPAASDSVNQTSTGNHPVFASTPSFTNLVPTSISPSTTSASSGSIFGLSSKPSNPSESFFKFGASADTAIGVTAIPPFNKSVLAEVKDKVHTDQNSSSESIPKFGVIGSLPAVNPGNTVSGFVPPVRQSTVNLQGSLFGSTPKSEASGTGTLSQGSSLSVPPTLTGGVSQGAAVSSTPSPLPSPVFNMNGNTSSSLFPSPQIFNSNNTLGSTSSASSSGNATAALASGPTSSVFKFGADQVSEGGNAVASSSGSTPGVFSFGLSSSAASSSAGANSSASLPKFNFGGNSSASVGSSTTSSSGAFNFGGSSSSPSTVSIGSSATAAANIFSSSWPSPPSSIFGSSSSSPSTGFSFGASSASASTTNAAPVSFNSSGASSSPFFSFTSTSAPASSSSSLPTSQPVFGNPFGSAPGNNDQMNAEDSMAEDPVQSAAASVPAFGQPSISPSPPPGFGFGSTVPSQPNPFMFSSQQTQGTPQSPSPFQSSGSLGGSFSLGSGGGDKSGRRIVKANRNKNRKR